MAFGIMGMGISIACIAVLLFVFRVEKGRGRRFGESVRCHLDRMVSGTRNGCMSFFGYISRDLRLMGRYMYHKLLSFFLKRLERSQSRIRFLIKNNRRSAHKSLDVTSSRNKLHEIADHKASVALSPEEKQKHREAVLNG